MFHEFFYHWKTLHYLRKSWKTLKLRPAFFTYGDSTKQTWAPTRQLTPEPPYLRVQHTPISSYQLPCAPFLRSRVTLCFRRSGVSGSYIRAAAAGTSTASSLFPRAKFKQVLLRYDISACTTYIHVRAGCRLAVEMYCTVCTSTWSFAAMYLARRVQARYIGRLIIGTALSNKRIATFSVKLMICDIWKIM